MSSYSSYLAFLEGYARAIASVETRWDRARAWLGEAITATHPEVRYDPRGRDQGALSVAFPAVSSARVKVTESDIEFVGRALRPTRSSRCRA